MSDVSLDTKTPRWFYPNLHIQIASLGRSVTDTVDLRLSHFRHCFRCEFLVQSLEAPVIDLGRGYTLLVVSNRTFSFYMGNFFILLAQ